MVYFPSPLPCARVSAMLNVLIYNYNHIDFQTKHICKTPANTSKVKITSSVALEQCFKHTPSSKPKVDSILSENTRPNATLEQCSKQANKALIIWDDKLLVIESQSGSTITIRGERRFKKVLLTSMAQAINDIQEGGVVYISYELQPITNKQEINLFEIVREYPQVCTEELSGLSPDKQVEFSINLIHRSRPLARAPYRLPR